MGIFTSFQGLASKAPWDFFFCKDNISINFHSSHNLKACLQYFPPFLCRSLSFVALFYYCFFFFFFLSTEHFLILF